MWKRPNLLFPFLFKLQWPVQRNYSSFITVKSNFVYDLAKHIGCQKIWRSMTTNFSSKIFFDINQSINMGGEVKGEAKGYWEMRGGRSRKGGLGSIQEKNFQVTKNFHWRFEKIDLSKKRRKSPGLKLKDKRKIFVPLSLSAWNFSYLPFIFLFFHLATR